MIKVLHITPHLSGGVGAVLLETLKYYADESDYVHTIVAFEALLDAELRYFADFHHVITNTNNYDEIKSLVLDADIVHVEWWTHPLIYLFLFKFCFPECRLLVCSHIAGFHRPNLITKNILEIPDVFLATTSATLEIELLRQYENTSLKPKISVVDYPLNFSRFSGYRKTEAKQFRIGYVGTLDYAKLHREFLSMTSRINIPEKIIIVGGKDIENRLEHEALSYPDVDFRFTGFVENAVELYEQMDVFGYPLNPKHFGTGEQALREAMFVGLPIVAFDNFCEREIIENGVTGLLVRNVEEYIAAIELLYQDKSLRERLGRNAKTAVTKRLSPPVAFAQLENAYEKIMGLAKSQRNIKFSHEALKDGDDADIGARLFIESLGHQACEFLQNYTAYNQPAPHATDREIANVEPELKVPNKGSLLQFLRYFPEDRYLNYWAELIRINEINSSGVPAG